MKYSEYLKSVLDMFGPNGEHWYKGWFSETKNGKTCYCLYGAMMYNDARRDVGFDMDMAQYYVKSAIGHYYPNFRGWVPHKIATWNDIKSRTFHDVEKVLLFAIEIAKVDELENA